MADRLEQVLQTTRLPVSETVPLIAELLAIPLPATRYEPLTLSLQQRRQQTYDLLVTWLLEEAERQPVLIVWEDLHWADPSTLELLGVLIDQMPTVPMLQVLTCRPEFTPPWPMRSHLTSIDCPYCRMGRSTPALCYDDLSGRINFDRVHGYQS